MHFHILATPTVYSALMDTGLSYDTNETALKDAFGKYGEIIEGNALSGNPCGFPYSYGNFRALSILSSESDMSPSAW